MKRQMLRLTPFWCDSFNNCLTTSSKKSPETATVSITGSYLGVAPIAQLVKGRLSDAGGPRFESQAGRVTGI